MWNTRPKTRAWGKQASFKVQKGYDTVDGRRELCSPFLKGGNSAFIAAMASGLFRQIGSRSLE